VDQARPKLRSFLSRYVAQRAIADGDDLFSRGLVNSLVAMQLVLFVEKEFAIQIANEDLEFENFRSIDAIARLVERKTAPPRPADPGASR
jgi:acyl carrier protein